MSARKPRQPPRPASTPASTAASPKPAKNHPPKKPASTGSAPTSAAPPFLHAKRTAKKVKEPRSPVKTAPSRTAASLEREEVKDDGREKPQLERLADSAEKGSPEMRRRRRDRPKPDGGPPLSAAASSLPLPTASVRAMNDACELPPRSTAAHPDASKATRTSPARPPQSARASDSLSTPPKHSPHTLAAKLARLKSCLLGESSLMAAVAENLDIDMPTAPDFVVPTDRDEHAERAHNPTPTELKTETDFWAESFTLGTLAWPMLNGPFDRMVRTRVIRKIREIARSPNYTCKKKRRRTDADGARPLPGAPSLFASYAAVTSPTKAEAPTGAVRPPHPPRTVQGPIVPVVATVPQPPQIAAAQPTQASQPTPTAAAPTTAAPGTPRRPGAPRIPKPEEVASDSSSSHSSSVSSASTVKPVSGTPRRPGAPSTTHLSDALLFDELKISEEQPALTAGPSALDYDSDDDVVMSPRIRATAGALDLHSIPIPVATTDCLQLNIARSLGFPTAIASAVGTKATQGPLETLQDVADRPETKQMAEQLLAGTWHRTVAKYAEYQKLFHCTTLRRLADSTFQPILRALATYYLCKCIGRRLEEPRRGAAAADGFSAADSRSDASGSSHRGSRVISVLQRSARSSAVAIDMPSDDPSTWSIAILPVMAARTAKLFATHYVYTWMCDIELGRSPLTWFEICTFPPDWDPPAMTGSSTTGSPLSGLLLPGSVVSGTSAPAPSSTPHTSHGSQASATQYASDITLYSRSTTPTPSAATMIGGGHARRLERARPSDAITRPRSPPSLALQSPSRTAQDWRYAATLRPVQQPRTRDLACATTTWVPPLSRARNNTPSPEPPHSTLGTAAAQLTSHRPPPDPPSNDPLLYTPRGRDWPMAPPAFNPKFPHSLHTGLVIDASHHDDDDDDDTVSTPHAMRVRRPTTVSGRVTGRADPPASATTTAASILDSIIASQGGDVTEEAAMAEVRHAGVDPTGLPRTAPPYAQFPALPTQSADEIRDIVDMACNLEHRAHVLALARQCVGPRLSRTATDTTLDECDAECRARGIPTLSGAARAEVRMTAHGLKLSDYATNDDHWRNYCDSIIEASLGGALGYIVMTEIEDGETWKKLVHGTLIDLLCCRVGAHPLMSLDNSASWDREQKQSMHRLVDLLVSPDRRRIDHTLRYNSARQIGIITIKSTAVFRSEFAVFWDVLQAYELKPTGYPAINKWNSKIHMFLNPDWTQRTERTTIEASGVVTITRYDHPVDLDRQEVYSTLLAAIDALDGADIEKAVRSRTGALILQVGEISRLLLRDGRLIACGRFDRRDFRITAHIARPTHEELCLLAAYPCHQLCHKCRRLGHWEGICQFPVLCEACYGEGHIAKKCKRRSYTTPVPASSASASTSITTYSARDRDERVERLCPYCAGRHKPGGSVHVSCPFVLEAPEVEDWRTELKEYIRHKREQRERELARRSRHRQSDYADQRHSQAYPDSARRGPPGAWPRGR